MIEWLQKGGGCIEKYKIAHYQKSGSMWFTNGGKFIITENEYIVKYLFQTVVRFEIDKTIASCISANPINKGIRLTDGVKEIDLYFFKKLQTNYAKYCVFNEKCRVVILTSKFNKGGTA